MKQQLFVGPEPKPELLKPVKNAAFHHKPDRSGMWTSTHIGQGKSEWILWCEAQDWSPHTTEELEQPWILSVSTDARIFEIDSLRDLQELLKIYQQPTADKYLSRAAIDFERMAQDYDALHLTENGERATRHTTPSLYGWDCESTVWFRWMFTKVAKRAA